MGMKNLMCEILVEKQKEYIKSLEIQIKNKNETILKETQRANEMFQLSYNRKLKIQNQQAEIKRLREEKSEIEIELKNTEQTCYGWQRLVESLEEQNNQLKAENDKLREALKKIILYAPGCYNTAECPLNVGGGFDNMCGYKCAFVIAHKALNGESEGK